MAGTWNLLKKIGQKKVDEVKGSIQKDWSDRIDKDLPLGLRMNGMVDVPEVDFILAGADLKVKHPKETLVVASIGMIPVGDSMLYRMYLNASHGVYVLQVSADKNRVVEECKFYMPYDEIYPDDWDFWLSKTDGYIGFSVFQTQDGTSYDRVWQDAGAETVIEEDQQGNRLTRIPPVPFYEAVYLDPYGEKRETVRYESMLYGRHVNEQVDEYLLLSMAEDSDGASIQIMVGIQLEPASVKVI
jgi:hypothetical protein